MKHVKLFEAYASEISGEIAIVNESYVEMLENYVAEDTMTYDLSEEDDEEDFDWLEDEELGSGEKAALARDFQILSKPQLAALYLRALGKAKEDDPGKYLVMVDGIDQFGEYDQDSRAFKLSTAALGDAIGLDSIRTVGRTVNKFVNLINGTGETSAEALYPKLLRAYEFFQNRPIAQIANLASEAVEDPATSTKHREEAIAAGPRAAAQRAAQKKMQVEVGSKVFALINSLRRNEIFRDIAKAHRAAVNKMANETGLTPERINLAYRTFLTDKGIMSGANYAM
jgi:type I site-specific restriction-modification system R (restriction) subunit